MDQNANFVKPKRGFAAMSPERQREIARKGGESVPPENRSFSRNRELAATAGRKGGEASHGHRSAASENLNSNQNDSAAEAPFNDSYASEESELENRSEPKFDT